VIVHVEDGGDWEEKIGREDFRKKGGKEGRRVKV
jgi:hypothetical protein